MRAKSSEWLHFNIGEFMSKLSTRAFTLQNSATVFVCYLASYASSNPALSITSRLLITAATSALATITFGLAAQYFVDKSDFKKCSIKDCATLSSISITLLACGLSTTSIYTNAR